MSAACSVCNAPQRDVINDALRQGVSLRMLEETYGVSRSSLSRHQAHTDGGDSPPPGEPAPAEASQPLAAPTPAATAGPLPKTRLKTCPICMLPDDVFESIEDVLGASEPSQSLALEHGVALSQLVSHVQHRASEVLARQRYEAEQHQAPAYAQDDPTRRLYPVQREIGSLVAEAEKLQQAALRAAGLAPALFVIRDVAGLLVRLAQAVAGEEG